MKKYWLLGLGLLAATSAWGIKVPTTLEGAKLSNGTLSGAITASAATISSPTLSGTVTASAATISSPTLSGTVTATGVTISAPRSIAGASAKGDLIVQSGTAHAALTAGSYGQVLTADSSQTNGLKWAAVASGINYVSYPDAENNATTGWSVYKDTPVGATPSPTPTPTAVPASLSLSVTSGTPIRGSYSFALSKAASNGQGEQISYPFTIANGDQARVMSVEFAYTVVSGTYTAETSTTNPDLIAYLYDVTNSTLIQPAPYKIVSCATGTQCRFQAEFQTASNSTSYRFIIHQSLTGTNSFVMALDDFKIGPSVKVFGAPVTDWVAYTPVITTASGTMTNYTATGKWRRVGDSIELDGLITFSDAVGTWGSVYFAPPSGVTIDTAKLTAAGSISSVLGVGTVRDAGVGNYASFTRLNTTSNQIEVLSAGSGGTSATLDALSQASPFAFGSPDTIQMSAKVPILGWSSSTQMSDSADTRVVAAKAYTGSGTINGTFDNNAVYSSVAKDTHGAYNSSTGVYTVPVAGYYNISASVLIAGTYAAGNRNIIKIYKNGSATQSGGLFRAQSTQSPQPVSVSTDSIWCDAGNVITIRPFSEATSPVYSADSDLNWFSITRSSGPSQIAASETVAAQITGDPASATVGNPIIVPTVGFDTHGGYTVGTGRYTVGIAGKYEVSGALASASAATSLTIYKNAVAGALAGNLDSNGEATFSGLVNCVGGDLIDVRPGGTVDATSMTLNIKRIGL